MTHIVALAVALALALVLLVPTTIHPHIEDNPARDPPGIAVLVLPYGDDSRRRSAGDSNPNPSVFQNNRDTFVRAPPRGPKALEPSRGGGGGFAGDFRGRGGITRRGGPGRNTWSSRDDSRDRDRDDFRRDGPIRDDRSRERDRVRDYRDRENDFYRRRPPSPQGRVRSPQGRDFRDRDVLGVDADRARRESRDGPLSAGSSNSDPPFPQTFRGSSFAPRGGRGGRGRADYDRSRGRYYDDRPPLGDRYARSRSQEGRQDGRSWTRDDRDRDSRHPPGYDSFTRRDSYVSARDNDDDRLHRDRGDLIRKPERASVSHETPAPKDISPPPLAPPAPAFGSQLPRPPPPTDLTLGIGKAPPTGPRAERPASAEHSGGNDARLPPTGPSKQLTDRSPTIPIGPRAQGVKPPPRPSSKQWINPNLKKGPESPRTSRSHSFVQNQRPGGFHDHPHDFHDDHDRRPRSSDAKTDDGRHTHTSDHYDIRGYQSARASMERDHHPSRQLDFSHDVKMGGTDEKRDQDVVPKTPSPASTHDESEKKTEPDIVFAEPRKPQPAFVRHTSGEVGHVVEGTLPSGSDSDDDEEEIDYILDQEIEKTQAKLDALREVPALPLEAVPQFLASKEEVSLRLVEQDIGIFGILGPIYELPEEQSAQPPSLVNGDIEMADAPTEALLEALPKVISEMEPIVKDEPQPEPEPMAVEPANRDVPIPAPASIQEYSSSILDKTLLTPPAPLPPTETPVADSVPNGAPAVVEPEDSGHIEPSVEVMDLDDTGLDDRLLRAGTEATADDADVSMNGAGTDKELSPRPSEASQPGPLQPSGGIVQRHSTSPPEDASEASAVTKGVSSSQSHAEPDSETDFGSDMALSVSCERVVTPPIDSLPRYKGHVPWHQDRRYQRAVTIQYDMSQYIRGRIQEEVVKKNEEQKAARACYAQKYEEYIRWTQSDDPVAVKSRDQFSTNPKEEVKEKKPNGREPTHENTRSRRYASERDIEKVLEMSKREADERKEREEQAQRERRATAKEAAIPVMYWTDQERNLDLFPNRTGLVRINHLITDWEALKPINNFTQEEQQMFEKNYLESNKFWGKVAQGIPQRSYQGCIQYYYLMKRELNLKEKLKKQPKKRKSKQRTKRAVAELGNGDIETDENVEVNENGERRRPRRAAAPTFNSETPADSEHGTPAGTPGRRRGQHNTPVGDSGAEKPEGGRKGRRARPHKEKEPKLPKGAHNMPGMPAPSSMSAIPVPIPTIASTGTPGPPSAKSNRSRSNSRVGWASPQMPVEKPTIPSMEAPSPGLAPPFVLSTPISSVEKQEPGPPIPPTNLPEAIMPPQLRPDPILLDQLTPLSVPAPSPAPPFERPAPSTTRARGSTNASSYWSVAESENFPGYLEAFGNDWGAIASYMETKTSIMVKNYYMRQKEGKPEWERILDQAQQKKAQGIELPPPPSKPGPNMGGGKRKQDASQHHNANSQQAPLRQLVSADANHSPRKVVENIAPQPVSRLPTSSGVPIAQALPRSQTSPSHQTPIAPVPAQASPQQQPQQLPLQQHGPPQQAQQAATVQPAQQPMQPAPSQQQSPRAVPQQQPPVSQVMSPGPRTVRAPPFTLPEHEREAPAQAQAQAQVHTHLPRHSRVASQKVPSLHQSPAEPPMQSPLLAAKLESPLLDRLPKTESISQVPPAPPHPARQPERPPSRSAREREMRDVDMLHQHAFDPMMQEQHIHRIREHEMRGGLGRVEPMALSRGGGDAPGPVPVSMAGLTPISTGPQGFQPIMSPQMGSMSAQAAQAQAQQHAQQQAQQQQLQQPMQHQMPQQVHQMQQASQQPVSHSPRLHPRPKNAQQQQQQMPQHDVPPHHVPQQQPAQLPVQQQTTTMRLLLNESQQPPTQSPHGPSSAVQSPLSAHPLQTPPLIHHQQSQPQPSSSSSQPPPSQPPSQMPPQEQQPQRLAVTMSHTPRQVAAMQQPPMEQSQQRRQVSTPVTLRDPYPPMSQPLPQQKVTAPVPPPSQTPAPVPASSAPPKSRKSNIFGILNDDEPAPTPPPKREAVSTPAPQGTSTPPPHALPPRQPASQTPGAPTSAQIRREPEPQGYFRSNPTSGMPSLKPTFSNSPQPQHLPGPRQTDSPSAASALERDYYNRYNSPHQTHATNSPQSAPQYPPPPPPQQQQQQTPAVQERWGPTSHPASQGPKAPPPQQSAWAAQQPPTAKSLQQVSYGSQGSYPTIMNPSAASPPSHHASQPRGREHSREPSGWGQQQSQIPTPATQPQWTPSVAQQQQQQQQMSQYLPQQHPPAAPQHLMRDERYSVPPPMSQTQQAMSARYPPPNAPRAGEQPPSRQEAYPTAPRYGTPAPRDPYQAPPSAARDPRDLYGAPSRDPIPGRSFTPGPSYAQASDPRSAYPSHPPVAQDKFRESEMSRMHREQIQREYGRREMQMHQQAQQQAVAQQMGVPPPGTSAMTPGARQMRPGPPHQPPLDEYGRPADMSGDGGVTGTRLVNSLGGQWRRQGGSRPAGSAILGYVPMPRGHLRRMGTDPLARGSDQGATGGNGDDKKGQDTPTDGGSEQKPGPGAQSPWDSATQQPQVRTESQSQSVGKELQTKTPKKRKFGGEKHIWLRDAGEGNLTVKLYDEPSPKRRNH
ncbi:hypothetical protein MKZ38_003043 [Zalerion maritima]|uniref:Myb-like domain-containing protein n=1 Tax=Zalerion maritima TaxID=339359 RepID=A0AAD5RN75_9PEZI|nr:hypothetical protein MKZ38_003043 [Zalerion maritima]